MKCLFGRNTPFGHRDAIKRCEHPLRHIRIIAVERYANLIRQDTNLRLAQLHQRASGSISKWYVGTRKDEGKDSTHLDSDATRQLDFVVSLCPAQNPLDRAAAIPEAQEFRPVEVTLNERH